MQKTTDASINEYLLPNRAVNGQMKKQAKKAFES